MSAVFSPCGRWRYRLDRTVAGAGLVFLFCGINSSTAGPTVEDQTTMKWRGFTVRNGGGRYIAINPFAWATPDVRELARVEDPVGPDNALHIAAAIAECDVIVPCWGNRSKVPERLRWRLPALLAQFQHSGKPIRVFGLTKSGDPMHPLMLGYSTPLVEWSRAA